jgi:hypothetical protein
MTSICDGLTHPCLESLSEARLVSLFFLRQGGGPPEIDLLSSLSVNLRVWHWKD